MNPTFGNEQILRQGNIYELINEAYTAIKCHNFDQAKIYCLKGLSKRNNIDIKETCSFLELIIDIYYSQKNSSLSFIHFLLTLYHMYPFLHDQIFFRNKLLTELIHLLRELSSEGKNPESSPEVVFCLFLLLTEKDIENINQCPTIFRLLPQAYNILRPKTIFPAISTAISRFDIKNNFSYLLSSNVSQEQQKEALRQLVMNGKEYVIRFLHIGKNRHTILKQIIDSIIESDDWIKFDDRKLFAFIRIINFLDQAKADALISKINITSPELCTPKGLLAYRYAYQKITSYTTVQTPYHKKLKIAICISGQLRGYEQGFSSLMNSFNFGNHDIQIFVHTWKNIGRRFPTEAQAWRVFSGAFLSAFCQVFQGGAAQTFHTQYANLYRLVTDSSSINFEKLHSVYGTDNIVIEDDNILPRKNASNQEKMLYKIYKCNELSTTQNFDLVIRTRPDITIKTEQKLYLEEIYRVSRKENAIFSWGGGQLIPIPFLSHTVDDAFAIGVQQCMDIYSRAYIDMKKIFWPQKAYHCPETYSFHASLAYQLFAHGIRIEKLQGFSRSFVDPEKIPTESIYAALKEDIKTRKYTSDDELLLAACEQDLKTTNK